MRYGRWQDAMVAQTRIHDYYSTDMGSRYLMQFFTVLNADHSPGARLPVDLLTALHRRTIADAEPVYVSHEACENIDIARETFKPEKILPSDPFVPGGFCLFAKPMVIDDGPVTEERPWNAPNGLIPIRAIAWMSVHNEDYSAGSFWISHFVSVDDELELDPTDPRWVGTEHLVHMRRHSPISLVHQWQWTWGTGWDDKAYDHLDVKSGQDIKQARYRARQQLMLVQTLWRLGQQYIPARQRPEKPYRQEAKKKKLKHHDEVNVITLRRTKGMDKHEPTGRQLTIQFPVNGYWAIRHTVDGPRQVWVRNHMKGPEDAPLVVKKRAWDFKR